MTDSAGPVTALIVVDVQNDFCEGGSLAVAGGNRVAADVAQLLAGDHSYQFVVATRDCHIDPGAHFSANPDFVDSWPVHCVAGTPGAELHPALAAIKFAAVFDKGAYAAAYSGFEGTASGTSLGQWLSEHQVSQVDIVGIATDYCVKATALDAAAGGFQPTVLLGLTAAVSADNIPAVVEEFDAAGVIQSPRPGMDPPDWS